jgi:hypothetical protein
MSKVKVTISIDDARIDQISEVAKNLQSEGLDIEQTLPTVGVITGSIAIEDVNRLKEVVGVQQVEPERGFQLPPPDSNVQ